MKTLKQLSHDSFYNMQNYSQLTIDLIQEVEDLYASDYEVTPEEFGALAYRIDTILEVVDKTLEHDVKALEMLYFILNNETERNKL